MVWRAVFPFILSFVFLFKCMCQRITGRLKGTINLIQMTSPLLAHLSPAPIRSQLTVVVNVPSFGSELSLFWTTGVVGGGLGVLGNRSICGRSPPPSRCSFCTANTCHFTIYPPIGTPPPPSSKRKSRGFAVFPRSTFQPLCLCVRVRARECARSLASACPPPALAHRAKRGPYLSLS